MPFHDISPIRLPHRYALLIPLFITALLFVTSCASSPLGADQKKEPQTVEACTSDTSGKGSNPFEAAQQQVAKTPDTSAPDPHSIKGPSTAVISDENVYPVVENPQPALPTTVKSCDGETVEVTDVSRIVSVDLYGTLTEIVHSLGLGANVVGRDRAANFPQAASAEVVTPNAHDLNAESIIALNPTVVITDTTIGPIEVQKQLRDVGIPVIFFDPARTLNGIPAQAKAVGQALGVPDAGESLANQVVQDVVQATSTVPVVDPQLRITFLYIRGTAGVYLMAGPGSGADSLIQTIGATDVGTDIGLDKPFTPLTSEGLIKSKPDVIIMMTKGLESLDGVNGLLKIPGVSETPAGENHRVVDMEDTVLLSFGPRTGKTIQALTKAIYNPDGS